MRRIRPPSRSRAARRPSRASRCASNSVPACSRPAGTPSWASLRSRTAQGVSTSPMAPTSTSKRPRCAVVRPSTRCSPGTCWRLLDMQPRGCIYLGSHMDAYSQSNEMDEVFRVLADPSRRRLLDSLNARSGQTLRELCSGLDMARQSVSKHLTLLEAANLVTSVRRGREKLHYLNAAPINEIGERWIASYERGRVQALADLKRALEDTTVDEPTFVYSTYIRTTPEQLWRALTDPAFTQRYWGVTFDSDWRPGSP